MRASLGWVQHHAFAILDVLKFVMLLILAAMFVNFNVQLAHNTATTKDVATSIKQLILTDTNSTDKTNKNINKKVDSLNNKIDCIFHYFTTPNRSGDTTLNATTCDVNNPPKVMPQ